jgi:hypothetical protein
VLLCVHRGKFSYFLYKDLISKFLRIVWDCAQKMRPLRGS